MPISVLVHRDKECGLVQREDATLSNHQWAQAHACGITDPGDQMNPCPCAALFDQLPLSRQNSRWASLWRCLISTDVPSAIGIGLAESWHELGVHVFGDRSDKTPALHPLVIHTPSLCSLTISLEQIIPGLSRLPSSRYLLGMLDLSNEATVFYKD